MITLSFDVDRLAASARLTAAEVEAAVVEAIGFEAEAVVVEVKGTWPRRTGRSAEAFTVTRTKTGAIIDNQVPYTPHVHRTKTPVLALDEIVGPAVLEAVVAVPARAASAVARRI